MILRGLLAISATVDIWKKLLKGVLVATLWLVILASNHCGKPTVAIHGYGAPAVRSGQAIFTVPETAGVDLAEVPPAFEASMVYV